VDFMNNNSSNFTQSIISFLNPHLTHPIPTAAAAVLLPLLQRLSPCRLHPKRFQLPPSPPPPPPPPPVASSIRSLWFPPPPFFGNSPWLPPQHGHRSILSGSSTFFHFHFRLYIFFAISILYCFPMLINGSFPTDRGWSLPKGARIASKQVPCMMQPKPPGSGTQISFLQKGFAICDVIRLA
jgi:hypothetical protein